MKAPSVLVIGAGIGGMTAAIHLAKQGFRVTVLEKNARPGGRCDRISRDGHHFDTGPTLLVLPKLYESEFAALGVTMEDVLRLRRVEPTYHLVFDDGSQLALTSDFDALQKQLETLEPGSFAGFLRYMAEGEQHYRLGLGRLVEPDFRKPADFLRWENLPLLYRAKPFVKHYANMAHYFDDARLKAAFTFQDVYMGLSPFEAPATFSMMSYSELAHGVFYPQGGMFRIADALYTMARAAGVEFRFRTPVERIVIQAHRASGVMAEGEPLCADAVLANADLPYVYQNLLPPDGEARKLARKRYSCSVISFFWGADKPYPALGPHTLFLADDYAANFTSIIRDLELPANPSVYVHAPARLDPTMAPAGQDTLIGIVPVGHLCEGREYDWRAVRDRARAHVFRRLGTLGITDLQEHIKFEISMMPPSWRERYNLVNGSTHGLCHNLLQLGIFRPDLQHPQYRNLYFAGASTRPGTGIPTAMVSGRHAARRIMDMMR
jgi:phytoene desaturase